RSRQDGNPRRAGLAPAREPDDVDPDAKLSQALEARGARACAAHLARPQLAPAQVEKLEPRGRSIRKRKPHIEPCTSGIGIRDAEGEHARGPRGRRYGDRNAVRELRHVELVRVLVVRLLPDSVDAPSSVGDGGPEAVRYRVVDGRS